MTFAPILEKGFVKSTIGQNTLIAKQAKADANGNDINTTYETVSNANVQRKRLHILEQAALDKIIENQVDATSAYQKSVPAGALDFATLNKLGGKSVVWNQLVQNGNFADGTTNWSANYSSLEVSNGKLKQTVTNKSASVYLNQSNFSVKANHTYLFVTKVKSSSSITRFTAKFDSSIDTSFEMNQLEANVEKVVSRIWTIASSANTSLNIFLSYGSTDFAPEVGTVVEYSYINLIDLTELAYFQDPSTVTYSAFKAVFPADYYAYNAGEIVSADCVNARSVGRNLLKLIGLTKSSMDSLTPTNVHNIEEGKYIQGISYSGYVYNTLVDTPIFDENSVTVTTTGGQGDSSYGLGIPFKCKPNTTYSYAKTSSGGVLNACCYSKEGLPLTSSTTNSITTDANAYWIVLILKPNASSATVKFEDVQVKEGSTAQAYSPYFESNLPIPVTAIKAKMPLYGMSAGNVYEEVDFGIKRGYNRLGSIDLGSLNWAKEYQPSGKTGWVFRSSAITNIKTRNQGELANILCQKFTTKSVNNTVTGEQNGVIGYASYTYVYTETNYADATAFKTAMSGVMLYYELATPTEVDLSDVFSSDNLIGVEAGGTITFQNSHGVDFRIPVPNEETFSIKIQDAIEQGA